MKLGDVVTEQDLDLYIRSCRRVRFRQWDTENLSLLQLFKVFVHNAPETCYIKGSTQCSRGRSRSMYDFTKLARYYKPDVTTKELLNMLFEYYFTPSDRNTFQPFSILYCGTVRRYNFRSGYWFATYNRGGVPVDRTEERVNRIKRDIVTMFARDYRNLNQHSFRNLVDNYYGAFVALRNS